MKSTITTLKLKMHHALLVACTFFFLLSASKSFGQATCSDTVNVGGFELEGNLYSNTLISAQGDDWFLGAGGTHIGVIGTTAATSPRGISADDFKLIVSNAATNNQTYLQNMSVPSGTIVNGWEMLDAVAARDNHSPDSSIFTTGATKNGLDPTAWKLSEGAVPQKDDIIDIGGHLRRKVSDSTLFGFFFASLLATNGDKHVDFEIFRTSPVFNAATSTVSNTGPANTDGHTAYIFNSDHTIKQAGDILLAIDYGTGGTNPVGEVRIWVNPTNLDGNGMTIAQYMASGNHPIRFIQPTVFDGGNANGYGYAQISPLDVNATCLIFTIENKKTSLGTPWGNLNTSSAVYEDSLETLQLVEASINFSAYGIAISASQSACESLFGALLVKTRSSDSFTSVLKDYAGPYEFGNKTDMKVDATPNSGVLTCINTSVQLSATATANANIVWSPGGQTTSSITVSSPGTYIVTASNAAGCSASDTVHITQNITPPTVSAGSNKVLTCTTTSVTLTATASQGATLSWSPGGQTTASITTSTPGTYTVTATNGSNGCTASSSAQVTQDINPPSVDAGPDKQLTCTTTSATLTAVASPGTTLTWSPGGQTTASITVSSPGTYTVTVRNTSNGCTASSAANVTQDITPPNLTCGQGATLTCANPTRQICATAPGSTFSWSGPGISGSNTGSCITVNASGSYTVVATKTSNGCTASCSINVGEDFTKPSADAGADINLNCSNNFHLNLNAAAIGTGVTYSWSTINGGHITSGGTTATPLADAAGCYVLTVTKTSNGCVQRDTACATLNPRTPHCCITTPAVLPACKSSSNTLNSCSSDVTDYSWSVSTATINTPWVITGPTNGPSINYDAGTGTAIFKLVVTDNTTGCKDSCTLTLGCPGDVTCTYTQGAYGNAGGKHCDGQETIPFMTQALSSPLTIGSVAMGNYITFTSSDVLCLVSKLPGGKQATTLHGVATCMNLVGISLNKQGRFNNVLLAQTITLGLNLRIPSNNLGGIVLYGPYISTYASNGTCANGIPVGPISTFTIPLKVITYLKNTLGHDPTIQELYDFANEALGRAYIPSGGSPSLSDINNAIDAINEGFDECRILSGVSPTPPAYTPTGGPIVLNDGGTMSSSDEAAAAGSVISQEYFGSMSVTAYPNPFSEKTTIQIQSDDDYTNVSAEVYNLKGERVATLYNSSVDANKVYHWEVDGSNLNAGIYIYRIVADGDTYHGKVILIK